ncbi:MAG: hypothetical protein MW690_001658 [Methanophagales archaeon]|nr:hypothetical protein [Methanophagales archaeon]
MMKSFVDGLHGLTETQFGSFTHSQVEGIQNRCDRVGRIMREHKWNDRSGWKC